MNFRTPELIAAQHFVADFRCGKGALDVFLQRFALVNTASGSSRTFVSTTNENLRVIGYYSLAAASVEHRVAPERVRAGVPRYPIPAILLARLAVDVEFQGKGLGKALMKDALKRSLNAAESIGVRVILVHAKDADAVRFYRQFDFVASPSDPLHLMLLMKEVKAALSL